MLHVAILGPDVGQNRSENIRDHKLTSNHKLASQNRSENSLTGPKTGQRFSVSDLSLMVNVQPAYQGLGSKGASRWVGGEN